MTASRSKIVAALLVLASTACATGSYRSGMPVEYVNARETSITDGTGIESRDIISMTDAMVRDMLANYAISGRRVAPVVILDSKHFENDSSHPINKNLITDRLRIHLTRAANGRIRFIARERIGMVEQERALKRDGIVGNATLGRTRQVSGSDYRLAGRIMSLDGRNGRTGLNSSYYLISFEMVDLETSEIVWGNSYEFKKIGGDDVSYR